MTKTDKKVQILGLRKVSTIGIRQANKCMHLAAIAYNLKKYLKYTTKKVKTGANAPCKIAKADLLFIKTELLAFQAILRLLFRRCQLISFLIAGDARL